MCGVVETSGQYSPRQTPHIISSTAVSPAAAATSPPTEPPTSTSTSCAPTSSSQRNRTCPSSSIWHGFHSETFPLKNSQNACVLSSSVSASSLSPFSAALSTPSIPDFCPTASLSTHSSASVTGLARRNRRKRGGCCSSAGSRFSASMSLRAASSPLSSPEETAKRSSFCGCSSSPSAPANFTTLVPDALAVSATTSSASTTSSFTPSMRGFLCPNAIP